MEHGRIRDRGCALVLTSVLTLGLGACTMGHDDGGHPASRTGSASASDGSSPTSADPTAQQAFSKVQDGVRSARSASLEAKATVDGKDATFSSGGDLGDGPSKSHVAVTTKGSADVVFMNQDIYVRGDAQYWKSFGSIPTDKANRLSGRWLKGSRTFFASSVDSLRPKSLVHEITDDNGTLASSFGSSSAHLVKTSYAGKDAYQLTGDDGRTKVWCSADGKFTLFKIEQPDRPEDFSSATFSNWNSAPKVTAPQGATTIPDRGSSSTDDPGTTT